MSGQAIYIGGAEPADFERLDAAGVDLAGKVVVAHSVFPFDLVALLTERGIAGFVHVCETPDGIVGNFTGALYPPPLAPPWEGRPLPYAGVTIGHLAARELISALTCGRSGRAHHRPRGQLHAGHHRQRRRGHPGRGRGGGGADRPLRQPGRGAVRL